LSSCLSFLLVFPLRGMHNATALGYQRTVNFNDFLQNQQSALKCSPLCAARAVPTGKDVLPWFLCTVGDLTQEGRAAHDDELCLQGGSFASSSSPARALGDTAYSDAGRGGTLQQLRSAGASTLPSQARGRFGTGVEDHRRGSQEQRRGFTGGVHPAWRDVVQSRGATRETNEAVYCEDVQSQPPTTMQEEAAHRPQASTWGSFPWLPQAGSSQIRSALGGDLRRDVGRIAPSTAGMGPHAQRSQLRLTRGSTSTPTLSTTATGSEAASAGHHREGSVLTGFDNLAVKHAKNMGCWYKQDLRRVARKSKSDW